uniref:Uncharacterized protein n=1 Tax=Salix viminalis TaxID=40686 RepID=A0A6N2KWW8_SALVM
MLEKYPSSVEPAVWWPQQGRKQARGIGKKVEGNGWDRELEDEMREIVGLETSQNARVFRSFTHRSGSLGSAFAGTANPWAVVLGVAGGALASIVNAMEHGAKLGWCLRCTEAMLVSSSSWKRQ